MSTSHNRTATRTVDVDGQPSPTGRWAPARALATVDLRGFSLDGMVAQAFVQQEPGLVRPLIPVGTSPAGDAGPANIFAVLQEAMAKATAAGKHPKHFCSSRRARPARPPTTRFLGRLDERTADRDAAATNETIGAVPASSRDAPCSNRFHSGRDR